MSSQAGPEFVDLGFRVGERPLGTKMISDAPHMLTEKRSSSYCERSGSSMSGETISGSDICGYGGDDFDLASWIHEYLYPVRRNCFIRRYMSRMLSFGITETSRYRTISSKEAYRAYDLLTRYSLHLSDLFLIADEDLASRCRRCDKLWVKRWRFKRRLEHFAKARQAVDGLRQDVHMRIKFGTVNALIHGIDVTGVNDYEFAQVLWDAEGQRERIGTEIDMQLLRCGLDEMKIWIKGMDLCFAKEFF